MRRTSIVRRRPGRAMKPRNDEVPPPGFFRQHGSGSRDEFSVALWNQPNEALWDVMVMGIAAVL